MGLMSALAEECGQWFTVVKFCIGLDSHADDEMRRKVLLDEMASSQEAKLRLGEGRRKGQQSV